MTIEWISSIRALHLPYTPCRK